MAVPRQGFLRSRELAMSQIPAKGASSTRRSVFAGLLVFCLIAGAILLIDKKWRETLGPISPAVHAMLERQIIPLFEFREAGADEIIQRLNQIVERSPELRQFHFARWTGPLTAEGFHRRRPVFERGPFSESTPSSFAITMSLKNIPLDDVMRYATNLSGWPFAQKGEMLYLVGTAGSFEPIVERRFNVTRRMFDKMAGRVNPAPPSPAEVEAFLASQGVEFYEGASAELMPDGILVVRDEQPQIDMIAGFFPDAEIFTRFQRIERWAEGEWADLRERLGLL
jgi:hypothetical protein